MIRKVWDEKKVSNFCVQYCWWSLSQGFESKYVRKPAIKKLQTNKTLITCGPGNSNCSIQRRNVAKKRNKRKHQQYIQTATKFWKTEREIKQVKTPKLLTNSSVVIIAQFMWLYCSNPKYHHQPHIIYNYVSWQLKLRTLLSR